MTRLLFRSLFVVLAIFALSCADDATESLEDDTQSTDEPYSQEGIDAWGEAFDDLASGKSDQSGCSGVTVPDTDGFGGRVALTFDDGPVPASTNIVLDVLAEYDIKAAFFINGKRVNSDAARQTLQRIIDDGHILANHSHNHSNLRTLDLARVESEVDQTHSIIQSVGIDPLYFRFPFGSSSCATADLVRSFGYRITGWHTDSADWCFASSRGGTGYCDPSTFQHVPDAVRDDMSELVMQQVYRKNGGILLFHDVHMHTANAIRGIIEQLIDSDYSFVNIDDIGAFPLLNNDDLGELPWVGSECQDSSTCDFADDAGCLVYDQEGAQTGFCTMPCEGFCSDFPGRAPTFCVSLDEGETGECVSKAADQNRNCAALTGTVAVERTRFVGTSSAPRSTSTVCLPEGL